MVERLEAPVMAVLVATLFAFVLSHAVPLFVLLLLCCLAIVTIALVRVIRAT